MGQAFFYQVDPGLEVFPMLCRGWLVDPYRPWVIYRKASNLCRKFQFIGNFEVTQYLVTIARQHFNGWNFISKVMAWLENNVRFLPKRREKGYFFLKVDLVFLEKNFRKIDLVFLEHDRMSTVDTLSWSRNTSSLIFGHILALKVS